MEVRLQAQEDEITLLKSSLADALRKLRLHDQQIPLLKQQLIAINPSTARVLNQSFCVDGFSKPYRYSTSSLDGLHHTSDSHVSNSDENGEGSRAHSIPRLKICTSEQTTQTEPWNPEPERTLLALKRASMSLSLEDALPESVSLVDKALHKAQQESQEEEDSGEKEKNWQSKVEETIQRTTIKSLQQQHSKSSEESQGSAPQTPTSSSPAPPKEPTQYGSLTPILEGDKKLLERTYSEKAIKEPQDKTKQRMPKKAASSTNLLTRSLSLEGISCNYDLLYCLLGQSIKMFIRGRPITMYIPSNIQNYEELKMDLPSEKLELDWVYGYRGRDCRGNLYMLPSGEAVYFIACVVVLYHVSRRIQRYYRKHTDCVRCLAVHPNKVFIASGQTAGVDKDGKPLQPFVHIWDSATLTTLQQIGLGTFERGVGSVAFSTADAGTYLCVIDDSNEHMLSVWDWNKNSKIVEIKSTNEAVFAVEFNPADTNNIITCGKSHVYFWTLSAGTFTKKQGIFGKYKKPKFIMCFVFSLTGDVLTGDSEGNILTWGKSAADIRTLGKGAKETFQIMKQTRAHEGSVFTLCILQGGALLSGGGKDRRIIRWSADLAPERECEIPEKFGAVRTIADMDGEELLVGTTRNAILRGTFSDGFVAIVQGHVDEMWGLATHPSQNIFLTCGNDKQVCVWNVEEHNLGWCTTLEESGLCADFCPNGSVVSVGLSTGRWLVLDLQTHEVVSDLIDGNEQLSVMRYSPETLCFSLQITDGSCFGCCCSHDNFIYVYSVTEGGRRYMRLELERDVAGGCKLLRNRFESKDREWASYTCVLGFHVMVLDLGWRWNLLKLPDCQSGGKLVVSWRSLFVYLYWTKSFLKIRPHAPSHKYDGHGSHVTNVRFTYSDSHLLSLGGKDTCIFQWRIKRAGAGDNKDHAASSLPAPSSSASPEPKSQIEKGME
ncbi:Echinoderm microtubule-associated protein-like 3 [Bagarius yarrelli]|uniref:Echinoderm microtubule-associated protein-like 3 n=1 Tax=Bagarius yarrelli TaxID=175774 RepID=A0A556VC08_BAGYA|nr:Echinoderm microtubule-associated protein-like 3 [Bagarius yarrelli]